MRLYIEGGERQPWLTYNGEEITSGAQLIYGGNGLNDEDITDDFAPTVISSHFKDDWNAAYYYANRVIQLCRQHDIPTLFFELPTGHTLLYGPDLNYGVDTYQAFFDFSAYYLKDAPVKVIYTDPLNGNAGASVDSSITIKFTGAVSQSEIEKITIKDSEGNALNGVWVDSLGDTEWTFIPDAMAGSTEYTITVPATLKGSNGKAMGEEYTSTFITEYDQALSATVTTGEGTYYSFVVPELAEGANKYSVRFRVTNDAANVALIKAVSNFDANNPDASIVGDVLGKINLKGVGYYEVDVTEYVAQKIGQQVTFVIQLEKPVGENVIYNSTFDSSLNGAVKVNYSTVSLDNIDGESVMKAVIKTNEGRYVKKRWKVFFYIFNKPFCLERILCLPFYF